MHKPIRWWNWQHSSDWSKKEKKKKKTFILGSLSLDLSLQRRDNMVCCQPASRRSVSTELGSSRPVHVYVQVSDSVLIIDPAWKDVFRHSYTYPFGCMWVHRLEPNLALRGSTKPKVYCNKQGKSRLHFSEKTLSILCSRQRLITA